MNTDKQELNGARIDRIRFAMESARYEEGPEEMVTDLLSDLRHYCEANHVDIDTAWRTSEFHFEEET